MTKERQSRFFILVGLLVLLQLWGRCHAAQVLGRPPAACEWEVTTCTPDSSPETASESSVRPSSSSSAARSQSPPSSSAYDNHSLRHLRTLALKRRPGEVPWVLNSKDPHGNEENEKKPSSSECVKTPVETETDIVSGAASSPSRGEDKEAAIELPSVTVSAAENNFTQGRHPSQQAHRLPNSGEAPRAEVGNNSYREGTSSCGSSGGRAELEARPATTRISWPIYFRSSGLPVEHSLQKLEFTVNALATLALRGAYAYAQRLEETGKAKEVCSGEEELDLTLSKASRIHQKLGECLEMVSAEREEAMTTAFLKNSVLLVDILLHTPMVTNPRSSLQTLPFVKRFINRTPRTREDVHIALDQIGLSFLDIKYQIDRALRALESAIPREEPKPVNGKECTFLSKVQKLKERYGAENGGGTKLKGLLRNMGRISQLPSAAGKDEDIGVPATAPGRPSADKPCDTHSKHTPLQVSSSHEGGGDTGHTVTTVDKRTAGKPHAGFSRRFSFRRTSSRGSDSDGRASATAPGKDSGSESTKDVENNKP